MNKMIMKFLNMIQIMNMALETTTTKRIIWERDELILMKRKNCFKNYFFAYKEWAPLRRSMALMFT